jgi:hypothetical protein
LGERRLCKADVMGSSPIISTWLQVAKRKKNLIWQQVKLSDLINNSFQGFRPAMSRVFYP